MKTWILYVTFARDLEWLRYSLESVRKYATGFSGITIVVPTWDVDKFLQFERYSTPECPVLIKNFLEYPGKGFVHHLAMKCYGDVFCPDADFVLHMDPDCLVHAPITPEDYLIPCDPASITNIYSHKPVLVIEPYEALKEKHPARYNWKRVTEEALKFEVTHETMCRHPACHISLAYPAVRAHIERQHLTPFTDFVIKQKNSYPQGFGEFNTLGAYVMKFLSNEYAFIDRGFDGEKNDPLPKLTQMWSYQGTKVNMDKIKAILA